MTETRAAGKPFTKRLGFWIFIGFCGTVAGTQIPFFPVKITPETHFITEPLMKDGRRVDYFSAWEAMMPELPPNPQDNGFRMLLEAMGPSLVIYEYGKREASNFFQEAEKEEWNAFCEKYGLDPQMKAPYADFQTLEDFLKERFEASDDPQTAKNAEGLAYETAEKLQKNPWTDAQEPLAAEWLKKVSPFLDVLGDAVRKPYFSEYYAGSKSEKLSTFCPSTGMALRGAALALEMRIQHEMADGNKDAAIRDLCTLYRLGAGCRQMPLAVSALVGIAIQGLGDETASGILRSGAFTDAQLQAFDAEISRFAPPIDRSRVQRGEMLYMYDALQEMQRYESRWKYDWNLVRKQFAASLRENLKIMENPDFEQRRAELEAFWKKRDGRRPQWYESLFLSGRSRLEGDEIFETCMFPGAMNIAYERAETRVKLTRIAVALERFRLKNGAYPESLDALVPEFWPTSNGSIYADPSTGKETLVYRMNSGTFILYGLGQNLKDDGGIRPGEKGDDENFDVVF